MKLAVIALGTLKENYFRDACTEYLKRLTTMIPVAIEEIREETPVSEDSAALIAKALEKEGQRILERLREGDSVAALTPQGRLLDSQEFAQRLDFSLQHSVKRLVFVIGSSHGLAPAVMARSDWQLSFGPMTFPHQLARVMLLEQIYRGQMILAGRRYHK